MSNIRIFDIGCVVMGGHSYVEARAISYISYTNFFLSQEKRKNATPTKSKPRTHAVKYGMVSMLVCLSWLFAPKLVHLLSFSFFPHSHAPRNSKLAHYIQKRFTAHNSHTHTYKKDHNH